MKKVKKVHIKLTYIKIKQCTKNGTDIGKSAGNKLATENQRAKNNICNRNKITAKKI
mgnify:CR=1 FL=1